jgi:phosphohistidine phosphatase
MKRIVLLRHAKSSWEQRATADFDRPLAPRGKKAAKRLGSYLRHIGLRPDLVLCSGATRARDTWKRIAKRLDDPPEAVFEDTLYMAGTEALLARLRKLDDAVQTVMLIGHNPDLETLATTLASQGQGDALARLRAKYPTGGFAVIRIAREHWAKLAPGDGYLESFIAPRMLEEV